MERDYNSELHRKLRDNMKLNALGKLKFLQEFVDENGVVYQRIQTKGGITPNWRIIKGDFIVLSKNQEELELAYNSLLKEKRGY